jgi:endonuclease/exonuclease/phosphatase family metal-dependent hydrolase
MKSKARLIPVVLVLAAVYWHGSRRLSTGPDAGGGVAGGETAQDDKASTIRVGTFNIHGCKGVDGRRDPDRVALDMDRLDFVGLHEVRCIGFLSMENQAEMLGNRLQMGWLFAPAESQWWGRKRFGNAVLTRLPITRWQRMPLPRKDDYSFRSMLLAEVRAGDRKIRVLVAHVNQREPVDRKIQLDCVLGMFLSLEEPAILMGDLNTLGDDPAIKRVLGTPGVVNPVGLMLLAEEANMIDWILVRGLGVVDAGVRNSGASDHPLVWAELEILTDSSLAGPSGETPGKALFSPD